MIKKLMVRRGVEAELPTLDIGELGYCTDTNKLYVGSPLGNKLINSTVSSGGGNVVISNTPPSSTGVLWIDLNT